MLVKQILCPFHREDTPSLAIYTDGFRCFGCGRYGRLSELGLQDMPVPPEKPPEDLVASFRYINSLPKKPIRGLELPYDDEAYYITWPDRAYYKARYFDNRKGKYRCPSGHKQPVFVAGAGEAGTIVVEGELNALSIAQAMPEYTVISPGSAGEFKGRGISKLLPYFRLSSIIYIIADADAPGCEAIISLLSELHKRGYRDARWALMTPDANDVLCSGNDGRAKLRTKVFEGLGFQVEGGDV